MTSPSTVFKPQPPRLFVLGLHRIGHRGDTPYDPSAFSAGAEQLHSLLRFVTKKYRLVDLEEAMAFITGRRCWNGTGVLLTFDDGYIDQYRVAFPILKEYKAKAVFFLVSGFSQGTVVPWWDRIAWLVRNTKVHDIHLPDGVKIPLVPDSPQENITAVLNFYRSLLNQDPDGFVCDLANACQLKEEEPNAERMFISWQEALEMKQAGMAIGAHTHTHPILSKLDPADQEREMKLSRKIMEAELRTTVDVLAYPLGRREDFTEATQRVAKACGYRAAFSYYGGYNEFKKTTLLDVKRIPVTWGVKPEALFSEN